MKTRLQKLGLVLLLAFTVNVSSAQIYSNFTSPVNGVDYTSSVNGICVGCGILNPERAADTNLTNYAAITVLAGVTGTVSEKVKLTSTVTSGNYVGFIIEHSAGLVNLSLLNTYTINTYSGGVLQETKTGSQLVALLVLGSSTEQSIHFVSTKAIDEIELIVGSLASVVNDVNLYYGYGNSAALPVELMSFYGSAAGDQIVINWSTASESNNSHFEIEKLDAVGNVQVLSTISGAGNSVSLINYSFTDYSPETENNFYRLRQVDYDGEFTYSKVINVTNEKEHTPIKLFSDIENDKIVIEGEDLFEVQVINSDGYLMSKLVVNGNRAEVSLAGLKPGVYLVRITCLDGTLETKRIINY